MHDQHWYPNCIHTILVEKVFDSCSQNDSPKTDCKQALITSLYPQANDYIINVVVDDYVITAVHNLERKREKLQPILSLCIKSDMFL